MVSLFFGNMPVRAALRIANEHPYLLMLDEYELELYALERDLDRGRAVAEVMPV